MVGIVAIILSALFMMDSAILILMDRYVWGYQVRLFNPFFFAEIGR